MNRTDKIGLALIAAVFGLLGGALSSRCLQPAPAGAQEAKAETPKHQKLLAAEEIRLVDASDKVLAKLSTEGGAPGLSLMGAGAAKMNLTLAGGGSIVIHDPAGKVIWRTVLFSAKVYKGT